MPMPESVWVGYFVLLVVGMVPVGQAGWVVKSGWNGMEKDGAAVNGSGKWNGWTMEWTTNGARMEWNGQSGLNGMEWTSNETGSTGRGSVGRWNSAVRGVGGDAGGHRYPPHGWCGTGTPASGLAATWAWSTIASVHRSAAIPCRRCTGRCCVGAIAKLHIRRRTVAAASPAAKWKPESAWRKAMSGTQPGLTGYRIVRGL